MQTHRVTFFVREAAAGVGVIKAEWNDDFQPAQEIGAFETKAAAEAWIQNDAMHWVEDQFATRH